MSLGPWGVVDAFEDLAIFAVLCKLSQSNQEIFSATLVKVITSLTGSFLCFFFYSCTKESYDVYEK